LTLAAKRQQAMIPAPLFDYFPRHPAAAIGCRAVLRYDPAVGPLVGLMD
jgi:hypothetical protein